MARRANEGLKRVPNVRSMADPRPSGQDIDPQSGARCGCRGRQRRRRLIRGRVGRRIAAVRGRRVDRCGRRIRRGSRGDRRRGNCGNTHACLMPHNRSGRPKRIHKILSMCRAAGDRREQALSSALSLRLLRRAFLHGGLLHADLFLRSGLAWCRRLSRRRLPRRLLPRRLAEDRVPIVPVGLRHRLLVFAAAVAGGRV
jgi:hypothetical protein